MKLQRLLFALFLITACVLKAPHSVNLDPKPNYKDIIVKVLVNSKQGVYISAGSGIVIATGTDRFLVITAKHVLEAPKGVERVIQINRKGVTSAPATLIFEHPYKDVAILSFASTGPLPVAFIQKEIYPTREVVTAGFPLQIDLFLAQGLLGYKSNNIEGLWVCTAPTFPGNSGGGIFDKKTGRLIGISIAVSTYNRGFTVQVVPYLHLFLPIVDVADWMEETMEIVF